MSEHENSAQDTVDAMIQRTVERMYTESEENRFLEVTYANGDKEVLYFKDFNSGAMIENIVARPRRWPSRSSSTPARRASGSAICWLRASTSSARTRTCRTPPTRTTGHVSRQEGRAHRLYQDLGLRQDRHRGGPFDRHRGEHRTVPLMVVRAKETCPRALFARNGIRLNYMSELKAPRRRAGI